MYFEFDIYYKLIRMKLRELIDKIKSNLIFIFFGIYIFFLVIEILFPIYEAFIPRMFKKILTSIQIISPQVIQLKTIIAALFIPFLTIKLERNRTEKKLKKDYQKCFHYILEIIFYSVESIQGRQFHDKVLIRSIALNFYQKQLSDMKITQEGIPYVGPSTSKLTENISSLNGIETPHSSINLWILDRLLIAFSIIKEQKHRIENIIIEIDTENISYIYRREKNLKRQKNMIFEDLEKIREEFKLKWDEGILNYLHEKN